MLLLNTCAVREHAEQRVLGRINDLARYKQSRPGVLLGVTGCMAQHLRGRLLAHSRWLDLVIGPDGYRDLPALLERAAREPVAHAEPDPDETYGDLEPRRAPGVRAWVTVQRGCDKFCTYCVVPYARGRERSLPLEDVLRERPRRRGRGLPRGRPARPDGELVARRRPRLRRPAARRARRRGPAAPPLHLAPPGAHEPAPDRGDGRGRPGLPAAAPAAAVGLRPGARGDGPRPHAGRLRRAWSRACAPPCPTWRSRPTSSSASRARPRRTSSAPWTTCGRRASTARSCSSTRPAPTRGPRACPRR